MKYLQLVFLVCFSILFISCGGGDDSESSSGNSKFSMVITHNNAAGGSGLDYGSSIALDSSGNIYVTGYSFNNSGNTDMVIWKYTSAGVLDTSFGSGGIVVDDNAAGGSGLDYGSSIALDSSGNIYVVGYSTNSSGNRDMVIWKYKSSGVLDTSFDSDGIITYNGSGSDDGNSIVLDSNGSIYVTGYSDNSNMTIWKYTSSGILDTSFDSDGMVKYDSGTYYNSEYSYIGKSMVIDSNGDIYVSGTLFSPFFSTMYIWKYSNSSLSDYKDSSGSNGESIALDSSGNIYVSGYRKENRYGTFMKTWKYTNFQNLDTSFNSDGVLEDGTRDSSGNSVVVDSSGNIYVSGTKGDNTMAIWKYTSTGTLDTSFDSDGIAKSNGTGSSAILDSNDNIYVTGSINGDMAIWKY